MSYDIGIGTCIAFDGRTVTVKLDRAMVPRLVPAQNWVRTTASLRLRREQCSNRRAIEIGTEVCLDSARDSVGDAVLELGTGERHAVDLGVLIRDTAPLMPAPREEAPPPAPTPRLWRTPYTHARKADAPLSRFC